MMNNHRALICGLAVMGASAPARGFVPSSRQGMPAPSTSLPMAYGRYGDGRSSSRYGTKERSKRQERVGHVVRTELARIIQAGYPIKHADDIGDDLRRRISVVNADVSPDLRHARVTVSVIGRRGRPAGGGDGASEEVVDKRRAYSWLVRNTAMIRHAMARRLRHMKTCPDLTFVRADVGAAVDVMHLIEKVSEGYKREAVGAYGGEDDSVPFSAKDWAEEDLDDDDDGWVDFDDDEFDERAP